MSTPQDVELHRLAEAVHGRRLQLNLSVRSAAEMANMSKDTWMRVERGEPVRHMTYDRVEATLGWTVGSCRKVMHGDEPSFLDEAAATEVRFTAVLPQDLEVQIRDAVQGALIASTDDLTAAQIRQVNERAIAALRERGILPPAE
jgi:transcriptional regulator with XRE-family HTH domain